MPNTEVVDTLKKAVFLILEELHDNWSETGFNDHDANSLWGVIKQKGYFIPDAQWNAALAELDEKGFVSYEDGSYWISDDGVRAFEELKSQKEEKRHSRKNRLSAKFWEATKHPVVAGLILVLILFLLYLILPANIRDVILRF